MHRSYRDITSRISEEPKWWDENAVPRYDDFNYRDLGVYIRYAILAEIACQSCHKRMKVGVGYEQHQITSHFKDGEHCFTAVPTDIVKEANNFAWGDPPNHGCVGDTMGAVETAILQVWQEGPDERGEWNEKLGCTTLREEDFQWHRREELEGSIPTPEWFV